MTLTDILLALILAVLVVNFILNSEWWRRVKANTPGHVRRVKNKVRRNG